MRANLSNTPKRFKTLIYKTNLAKSNNNNNRGG